MIQKVHLLLLSGPSTAPDFCGVEVRQASLDRGLVEATFYAIVDEALTRAADDAQVHAASIFIYSDKRSDPDRRYVAAKRIYADLAGEDAFIGVFEMPLDTV